MTGAAWWESASDGGGASRNEDLVAVFERDGTTDILVLDGATSLVAAAAQGDGEGGNADVVWFVERFAAEFGHALDAGAPRTALLGLAAEATGRAWDARTAGRTLAPWAWPVASLSWVRIAAHGGGHAGHLTALGDCKTLLRLPDGRVHDPDPFENAQETSLYGEVAVLRDAGVLDAAERFARMLPSLRTRRTAQNLDPAPVVLGVRPQGPFATREAAFDLPPGAMLLVMSDGFWRLVDPYAVLTPDGLLDACARDGLAAVLARLRSFERGAGGAASLAVKRADDASAVAWHAAGRERALVERYLAAYNAFDVDGMLAQLAPQVRFEHHASGVLGVATDGIDAFRTLAEGALQLFAAREQRIVGWEQEPEAGQADGRATARAAIAWRGRLAADPDNELALQGESSFEFDNGRIVRIVDRA